LDESCSADSSDFKILRGGVVRKRLILQVTTMKCPTCNKDTTPEANPFRPFCSERCKQIDLGRWAGGDFRIPTQEKPAEESHQSNGQPEDGD
jgi:endogenous inhibitor of DNA gyrase (YacG/DUF329 family)